MLACEIPTHSKARYLLISPLVEMLITSENPHMHFQTSYVNIYVGISNFLGQYFKVSLVSYIRIKKRKKEINYVSKYTQLIIQLRQCQPFYCTLDNFYKQTTNYWNQNLHFIEITLSIVKMFTENNVEMCLQQPYVQI